MSEERLSYKQIIKSTGIFGGSQVITILIGILRTKIVAILLGTVGIGLMSMYQTILDMVKSLSAFGIETTGVREIASNNNDENRDKIIEVVSLVDRLSLCFAIIGLLVCILFSYPISIWAFDDSSYSLKISLLSISIFFSILAAGQTVVLHGLRQISYMVKSTLLWSCLGLFFSLPLYYLFREDGIIPAFIIMSIIMYLVSRYYRKKVNIESTYLPIKQIFTKGASLLRVGSFIVVSSVITSIGYFLIRAFLSRDMGLYSVGLFQAAWSITNVYLMLVLKSMGSDFYPRLCSIIEEKNKAKKLINEQTYIVLVVAIPIIILLLLSSRIILRLLYSAEFSDATTILNWQVLGTFFKVLSWPLGFILLAKGKGLLFFISETAFMLIYLLSTYFLYPYFKLEAVGIAYFVSYVIYLGIVYILGIKLSDFRWTKENLKIGIASLILILFVFCIAQYSREHLLILGIPTLIISFIYSFFKLNRVFAVKTLIDYFKNKKS